MMEIGTRTYCSDDYTDTSVYVFLEMNEGLVEGLVKAHKAFLCAKKMYANTFELSSISPDSLVLTKIPEDIEDNLEYEWKEVKYIPDYEDDDFLIDDEFISVDSLGIAFSIYEKFTNIKYRTGKLGWELIYKLYLGKHMEDIPLYVHEGGVIGKVAKEMLEG